MTHSRYGRLVLSLKLGSLDVPTTASNSACAWAATSGYWSMARKKWLIAVIEVSRDAVDMNYVSLKAV